MAGQSALTGPPCLFLRLAAKYNHRNRRECFRRRGVGQAKPGPHPGGGHPSEL